jgi:mannose-6-phosphate isomerase-like protein (cupin superfamily)
MNAEHEADRPAIVLVEGLATIRSRPRHPLEGQPGVTYAVLWSDGGSHAGAMWIDAGHAVGSHVHHGATHHAWVVEGAAGVDGRTVTPGGYWHVPAGVPHAVEGAPPGGCMLLYLYLRQG